MPRTRRRVLALLSSLPFGGALCRLLKPVSRAEAGEQDVERTVAAVADVMFPGEGLPSATELGIHRRVLETAELKQQVAVGVAWLDARAASVGAADFASLDEARKLAMLDAAFASRDDGIQSFVMALRFHIGTAYYSAPRIKSAFAYTGPPQPEGFPDFQGPPA